MEEIEERLAALEAEHRALSDRCEMMQSFVMAVISILAEEEDCEFLRKSLERGIVSARQSMQLDQLNHLQDLLRAFEVAMPKGG